MSLVETPRKIAFLSASHKVTLFNAAAARILTIFGIIAGRHNIYTNVLTARVSHIGLLQRDKECDAVPLLTKRLGVKKKSKMNISGTTRRAGDRGMARNGVRFKRLLPR